MKRAVYAGSFDPITLGHLWMVQAGAELFDELVVAIGVNPDKKYTFTLEQRLEMLRESIEDSNARLLHPGRGGGEDPRVRVDSFENQYLVNYAASVGARYILRGIRSEADYGYERGMRHINSDVGPDLMTVFLFPPRDLSEISSSLVKGLIGPEGWQEVIKPYVPAPVYDALLARFDRS